MNRRQLVVVATFATVCLAISARNAFAGDAITHPQPGAVEQNRKDFAVTTDIKGFDQSGKYWVAIASVKGHEKDWDRVLELYEKRNDKNGKAERDAELTKLLKKWAPDLFWPKYAVPVTPHEGRIFDGGQNPLEGVEPQPMIILVMKVDDSLDKYFRQWFRAGAAGKGYPGIPSAKLGKDMVVGRCELFFP